MSDHERKIILTGGGTAGHVTPNLALLDDLKKNNWQIFYIGSKVGVEKELVTKSGVTYFGIQSGKLRRYFSWQNFIDPFKITYGVIQAYFLIRKIKPNLIFSKGGFVAFPVVVAAWLNRIPIIAHESDISPGLANRMCFPFVNTVCVTFEAAKKYFKHPDKVLVTGNPIREQLFHGDRGKGLALCNFHDEKPCILVIGGSQGAESLNQTIRQALPLLTKTFQVIHICGPGKIDTSSSVNDCYKQFEYVFDELADLMAASDIIVSRSGANSLYEILALQKPHVLIPLSTKASRGDQVLNARYFEKQGISVVVNDDELTSEKLIAAITKVESQKQEIIERLKALNTHSSVKKIIQLIHLNSL